MTYADAYEQGARDGHAEGRARCGVYVVGEEVQASWDASDAKEFDDEPTAYWWAKGFRHGYLKGAEGSELEPS